MYKVVSECNPLEVWAVGFFCKENTQQKIDSGYFHAIMYESDRGKKLIVVGYEVPNRRKNKALPGAHKNRKY